MRRWTDADSDMRGRAICSDLSEQFKDGFLFRDTRDAAVLLGGEAGSCTGKADNLAQFGF